MNTRSPSMEGVPVESAVEAQGARRPSWSSKPARPLREGRRVGSTPTRFRHSPYAVPVASPNSLTSNPDPRITGGVPDLLPCVGVVSAGGRPRALELRLHFLEPLAGLQGGSALQSVPVSRLEILELPVPPIVGARDVCRSPVSDFDRRIQRLSGGVTGRSACRSQTGADRMRSGLARDRIPVGMDAGFEGLLRVVHFSISLPVSSACKDGAIRMRSLETP